MELDVSYHWTHLEYDYPSWRRNDTWGPVAHITITATIDTTPFSPHEKNVSMPYSVLEVVIETGNISPCDQIIQAIEKFAAEKNIKIEYDFIEKWKRGEKNTCIAF